jgi:hypothetical protein
MEKAIDFKKYKIDLPRATRPQNNKHYKRLLRKVRRDLPHLNG